MGMTRTLAIDRHAGHTIEPSRAWILGLTVGPDGGLEWHGPVDADDASETAVGFAGLACECPDDCPRDHPNE
jgi:hypothetical protein